MRVVPGPEGSNTNSPQHPRLSPGGSWARSQGLQAGRWGEQGAGLDPQGTTWASRREQAKANQERDWTPTDLHMWGVWALHRDTPTELFSAPETKLGCTKPEVTIPLAVQTWVETGSWWDEESVRMAYGSQLLHGEKSRTMEGRRKEGLGLERCST